MGDIYKKMAAKTADCGGEDNVTDDMRARAKAAFWETLTEVAQLPGNGALLTALKAQGLEELQFANFEWQPRWNGVEAVAALSTDGPAVFATGFFGVLRYQRDDKASCEAIVNGARRFADMVEQDTIHYLGG
jgi:hypothetical protein